MKRVWFFPVHLNGSIHLFLIADFYAIHRTQLFTHDDFEPKVWQAYPIDTHFIAIQFEIAIELIQLVISWYWFSFEMIHQKLASIQVKIAQLLFEQNGMQNCSMLRKMVVGYCVTTTKIANCNERVHYLVPIEFRSRGI